MAFQVTKRPLALNTVNMDMKEFEVKCVIFYPFMESIWWSFCPLLLFCKTTKRKNSVALGWVILHGNGAHHDSWFCDCKFAFVTSLRMPNECPLLLLSLSPPPSAHRWRRYYSVRWPVVAVGGLRVELATRHPAEKNHLNPLNSWARQGGQSCLMVGPTLNDPFPFKILSRVVFSFHFSIWNYFSHADGVQN